MGEGGEWELVGRREGGGREGSWWGGEVGKGRSKGGMGRGVGGKEGGVGGGGGVELVGEGGEGS